MVAGYHLIWTAYGTWLPNDPRGSSSHEIRCDALRELGELHHGRKKIQPSSKILREFYRRADVKLKHEKIPFTDDEIALIGDAFASVIQDCRYTCYGCAILSDHVHILIRKHRDQAEEMIGNLQERSWQTLVDARRRPSDHPVWGGPGWKVYLDSRDDVARTVRYIQKNPIKARQPAQSWPFVRTYDGWLPGFGRI